MDYKDKLRQIVLHEQIGEGIIIEIDKYFKIDFKSKTSLFPLDSFEKGILKFKDINIQNELENELNKKKIKDAILNMYLDENCSYYKQIEFAEFYEKNNDYDTANNLYENFSSMGNYNASLILARKYQEGKTVHCSLEKAFYYYEKAYNQIVLNYEKNMDISRYSIWEFSEICANLYEMCYKGIGTKKNIDKAAKYYEELINSEDGYKYYEEKLESIINAKKLSELENKINDGDVDSIVELADLYCNSRFIMLPDQPFTRLIPTKNALKKALELYEAAINMNHPIAMYQLADLYRDGKYLDKDEKKAFELYNKSANLDCVHAYYKLGICYEYGYGTNMDLAKAIEYYTIASNKGHFYATLKLASIYLEGEYVKQDVDKAYQLINSDFMDEQRNRANNEDYMSLRDEIISTLNKNDDPANELEKAKELLNQSVTNKLHETIINDKQKLKEAIDILEKLVINDNVAAIELLSDIYYGRINEAKNPIRALELYNKYFELNKESNYIRSKMYYNMGLIYLNGEGVLKDINKAFEMFNNALSSRRNADAAVKLVEMYFNGIGVEIDINKGIELLNQYKNSIKINKLSKYLNE